MPASRSDRLLTFLWRGPPPSVGESARRRVTLHLVPWLFFLYVLAYLDRVNVAVAALGLEAPPDEGGLGFGRDVIGFGASVFFWGYWILEIPSAVSVSRRGARRVLTRVLVLWGLCATLAGLIGTPVVGTMFGWLPHVPTDWPAAGYVNGLRDTPAYQFYFLRFMLGVFEGGFFPSVIVYLSHWFPARDRARSIAGFTAAIPLSNVIGSPLSGALLGVNWAGLSGWRWVFLLEGAVPILAGIVTFFLLPDRPADARWLRPAERDWLARELAGEAAAKLAHGPTAWRGHLGLVFLLTAVYFCQTLTSYGLQMFMPAIIKSQSGLSNQAAAYLASGPYLMALIGLLVNGWHSDHTGERFWHTALPLGTLGLGVLAAALTDGVPVLPVAVMIFWVGTALHAHMPAFWPIPTTALGATAAASAVGFINMVGNLGGSVGPMIVGNVSEGQTSFAPALLRIAPWPIAAAVVVLALGYAQRKRPV
jgi:MFS transporter, ACS family, tartrate transporter